MLDNEDEIKSEETCIKRNDGLGRNNRCPHIITVGHLVGFIEVEIPDNTVLRSQHCHQVQFSLEIRNLLPSIVSTNFKDPGILTVPQKLETILSALKSAHVNRTFKVLSEQLTLLVKLPIIWSTHYQYFMT